MASPNRLLFLELNEFNDALLRGASKKMGLKNIQRIFELNHCHTFTNDTYESDWLEPWVQWVSIHTGKTSLEHGIKHLGDVPSEQFGQIWEKLAQSGFSTGVWGVLNGSRGKGEARNLFFMPDPWTFSERAYPAPLNRFLDLPRYMATNRLDFSWAKLLRYIFRLSSVLLGRELRSEFLKGLPRAAWYYVKYRGADFVGFCFLEYLSGLLFLKNYRESRPDFGVLFMNSIAHLQHYYWNGTDYDRNIRLSYGLRFVDRLLERLFQVVDSGETKIMISNGLSQKNTNREPEWVSYRPKDHRRFLTKLGCNVKSVEPLMSYDALVFFPNEQESAKAFEIISNAEVEGVRLFLVERYADNPQKLFYRFSFTSPVDPDARCRSGEIEFRFGEVFEKIITRTGKHIGTSDLYASDPSLPARLPNHEIFGLILKHFGLNSNRREFIPQTSNKSSEFQPALA